MNDNLKDEILALVEEYHQAAGSGTSAWVAGESRVLASGAVLTAADRMALVEAALDLRIASGSYAIRFERALAAYFGLRKAHLVNSGSSANLLALAALTAPELGDRALRRGDEVITVAAGFPTTVNPIIQNGMVPVFVDIDLNTYNTTAELVEAAIGPKTRAIMIAHALGNPFEAAEIRELADRHGLWFVEDNCDAVGSTYRGAKTGTFGHLSTVSFYPAHHLTMGEGGCVLTGSMELARLVESFRDWGRDCWCEPGEDDRCNKRFGWQQGTLPFGYDHKYIFSHVGYNLKATDLQAALGLSQLERLSEFCDSRRKNWARMRSGLQNVPGLTLPEPAPNSDPSWFGFTLTVQDSAPYSRRDLQLYLESKRISTRLLFSGNLTRHPAYEHVEYRISGSLANSDKVVNDTLWIGIYPGVTEEMIDYVIREIWSFAKGSPH
ncbi:lipopolysaccharide biosynthesis protein RfbH [Streptomyces sp. NBC_01255]|uniref:lipopolysaccharide biosynthesis protein RfbH n=1 Tax=Streptomyces sp. NBC_01255 TaxID=2903798 RepID=UPI002E370BA4|nr:lipopolysaccharide biosynthesis protein RfbH [Streptomyces sp. NBC_01255]